VANEGKLIAICSAKHTEQLLVAMRSHPLGRDAALIGQVVDDANMFVEMETALGGVRMVDWLAAEQLPRIC
jgi:hydrogenase expression/formation protein HypE